MTTPRSFLFFLTIFIFSISVGQQKYTHSDTLKGTYSKERAWWDVLHYDLSVTFMPADSAIKGKNRMSYKILQQPTEMQIDLLRPMVLDSIVQNKKKCSVRVDGDAYFVTVADTMADTVVHSLEIFFHGRPIKAKNAPWDGGIIWSQDKKGKPWISIACQGMAARVWFPNKDHQADEPDSVSLHFTVPRDLIAVSNGQMTNITPEKSGLTTYHWRVKNPINNYNIIPYIGRYVLLKDSFSGRNGQLELSYWVLNENYERAKIHFTQVKPMLRCFEEWFGPYPFYEDGYKLVEAPFLGMEHQSAIAYGNGFQQGYKGKDLSQTGLGLKWDFIVVHESGHEWFGNNITAKDVADNWIHESFTAYSENIYTEYLFGKEDGARYVIGTRSAITNDKPIISDYNVNAGGSIDLYYKGSNMLHTIRQIVNDDFLWKELFRSLNQTFWHQTVTTKQIEDHMSTFLKIDLQKIFDQYLRTTQVPVFEYKVTKKEVTYRWTNCNKGFNMPMAVYDGSERVFLKPSEKWQKFSRRDVEFRPDINFYVGLLDTSKK